MFQEKSNQGITNQNKPWIEASIYNEVDIVDKGYFLHQKTKSIFSIICSYLLIIKNLVGNVQYIDDSYVQYTLFWEIKSDIFLPQKCGCIKITEI